MHGLPVCILFYSTEYNKSILYTCLAFGGIVLLLIGIVLVLRPIQYYTYHPGSKACTDYVVLSPDVIECGAGDSCSYRGVYTTVADGFSLTQPVHTWLVHKDNLKFYRQQTSTVHYNGTLSDTTVLFDFLNPVYTFKGSVFSGFCSVHNQNSENATAKLEIYSNYSDAVKATGKSTVFSETLSIPANSLKYFRKWGTDSPFTVSINGYYFFLLSVSADNMYYSFQRNTTQVYVNESDYRNPQYFTSENRSYYSYGKCHRNGWFKPIDYVTLCKAPYKGIEFRILSCPKHLKWSDKQTNSFVGSGIALSLAGIILILLLIIVCIANNVWQKFRYRTTAEETN